MRIWAGHSACMGRVGNAYKMLSGKYDGKRPLWKPRCRWEDTIRILKKQCMRYALDSSGSMYVPVVGHYKYGNEPSVSITG